MENLSIILEYLNPILSVLIQTAVCILAVVVFKFAKKYLKKMGIDVSDDEFNAIMDLVAKAIQVTNQKIVNDMKQASSNGKLSDEQKQIAYNNTLTILKKLLTSEQIDLLLKKYDADDIDDILYVLIESSIDEYKTMYIGTECEALTEVPASIVDSSEPVKTKSDYIFYD